MASSTFGTPGLSPSSDSELNYERSESKPNAGCQEILKSPRRGKSSKSSRDAQLYIETDESGSSNAEEKKT